MANQPYQFAIDELSDRAWWGTAIDVVLGQDESGNHGFLVRPHKADPIADAAMAMRVDSIRESARAEAQALKLALNSLYGSFGAPVAVMPSNVKLSMLVVGGMHAPPMRIVSKNYGIVSAAPASPLIDAGKVKPNRREHRSNRTHVRILTGRRDRVAWMITYEMRPRQRRAGLLPWWRRLHPGERMSLSYARTLADLKLIGIADPFMWGIDERHHRCAVAERDRWRDARHARLPEPRAPELRTRRGRACSQAESYRLCP